MQNLFLYSNSFTTSTSLHEQRLVFIESRLDELLGLLSNGNCKQEKREKQEEWEVTRKKWDAALAECKKLLCDMKDNPNFSKEELDALEVKMSVVEQALRDKTRARLRATF